MESVLMETLMETLSVRHVPCAHACALVYRARAAANQTSIALLPVRHSTLIAAPSLTYMLWHIQHTMHISAVHVEP